MSGIADRHAPSPHWEDRRGCIAMIVLHEEPADGLDAGVAWLCNPASGRSLHYLIGPDGTIVQLVVEGRRARHCDGGHWRDLGRIDDHSIALGLVRPDAGGARYPDAQTEALCRLVDDVKTRHGITRGNIVGHSDVDPAGARDPGEWFPWHSLARLRLALPRPTRNLTDPQWSEAGFLLALERFGYAVADPMAAIMAFQRRFRPEMIDGEVDAECRMILLALLLPRPTGDD